MKRSTASKVKDINRLFAELASKRGARVVRFNARPTVPRRDFRKYIAAQWHALFCGSAARFMLALPGERGDEDKP